MSIYFSTGGFKNQISKDVVKTLIDIGIKDIELSGTCYSKDNVKELEKFLEVQIYKFITIFPHLKNHLF